MATTTTLEFPSHARFSETRDFIVATIMAGILDDVWHHGKHAADTANACMMPEHVTLIYEIKLSPETPYDTTEICSSAIQILVGIIKASSVLCPTTDVADRGDYFNVEHSVFFTTTRDSATSRKTTPCHVIRVLRTRFVELASSSS